MLSKKGGRLFKLVTLICLSGCGVMLYLGFYFFKDRTTAFVLFNAYIVLLTGLIIFMARYYIKTYITD